jgi:signal transduction histidine kinase
MQSRRLDPDLENAVFRIVQEALTNVERHSGADEGEVDLSERDGRLRIEVRDRGVGFDPLAVSDGRFGLEGVQERARLAGGTASIESAPGKGTRVVVDLPITAPGAARAADDDV